MIWFGWNSGNSPTPVVSNAVNDGFAVYDYTESYDAANWRYIFLLLFFF